MLGFVVLLVWSVVLTCNVGVGESSFGSQKHCTEVDSILNSLICLFFWIFVVAAGYCYGRHCGEYFVDDVPFVTKMWTLYSSVVMPFTFVIYWFYLTIDNDLSYVGNTYPLWLVYCATYVSYASVFTSAYIYFCRLSGWVHPWAALLSTVNSVLVIGTIVTMVIYMATHTDQTDNFKIGLAAPHIRYCLNFDYPSLIITLAYCPLLLHHCIVVLLSSLSCCCCCCEERCVSYLTYRPAQSQKAVNNGSETEVARMRRKQNRRNATDDSGITAFSADKYGTSSNRRKQKQKKGDPDSVSPRVGNYLRNGQSAAGHNVSKKPGNYYGRESQGLRTSADETDEAQIPIVVTHSNQPRDEESFTSASSSSGYENDDRTPLDTHPEMLLNPSGPHAPLVGSSQSPGIINTSALAPRSLLSSQAAPQENIKHNPIL